jgi:hypothetical protein
VGRERVSEGVGGDAFRDRCLGGGPAHGTLDAGLVEVMTAADAASRIDREPRRREDPLPSPLAAGAGELAFEGVGQPDAWLCLSVIAIEVPRLRSCQLEVPWGVVTSVVFRRVIPRAWTRVGFPGGSGGSWWVCGGVPGKQQPSPWSRARPSPD